jgi:hypothetical protein
VSHGAAKRSPSRSMSCRFGAFFWRRRQSACLQWKANIVWVGGMPFPASRQTAPRDQEARSWKRKVLTQPRISTAVRGNLSTEDISSSLGRFFGSFLER